MAGNLSITLNLDTSGFSAGVKGAIGGVNKLSISVDGLDRILRRSAGRVDRTARSYRSFGHTIRDVVATIGLGRAAMLSIIDVTWTWQKAIIQANMELERSGKLLENFASGDTSAERAKQAAEDVEHLLDMTSRAPFAMSALTDSYVKLRVAGIEPAKQSHRALVDAVAAFGGQSEHLKRASVALQQMAGKGTISMEELRQQLGESVPGAIKVLAQAVNMDYDKMVKQISLGNMKAAKSMELMMLEMDLQYAGGAERMMQTLQGQVEKFKAQMVKLAADVGDAGYMDALKKAMLDFNLILESSQTAEWGRQLGVALASVISYLADATQTIIKFKAEILEIAWLALQFFALAKGVKLAGAAFKGLKDKGSDAVSAVSTSASMATSNFLILGVQATAASVALGSLGYAFRVFRAHAATSNGVIIGLKAAFSQLAGRAALAGGSIVALRSALMALLPGLGIIVAVIAGVTYAWGSYKDAMQAAREEKLKHSDDQDFLDVLKREEKILKSTVSYLEKQKALSGSQQAMNAGHSGSSSSDAELNKAKSALAAKEKEVNAVTERVGGKAAKILIDADNKAILDGMSTLQKTYKESLDKIDKLRKEEYKKIGEDGRTAASIDKDLNQQKFDAAITAAEGIKTFYLKKSKEINGIIIGPAFEDLSPEEQAKTKAIFDHYFEMVKEADDRIKQVKKNRTIDFDEIMNISGSEIKGGNNLDNAILAMIRNVSKLKAGLEETNPYLKQIEALRLKDYYGQNPDPDKMGELKKLAEERHELDELKKAIKSAGAEADDVMIKVGQITAKYIKDSEIVANTNPFMKNRAQAEGYKAVLDELNGKLEKAKYTLQALQQISGNDNEIKSLETKIAELKVAMESIGGTKGLIDETAMKKDIASFEQMAQKLETSVLPAQERVRVEHEKTKEALDHWFDTLATQTPEAEAAYNRLLEALETDFSNKTRTPMDRMLEDWRVTTDNMEQLYADMMDGFVDSLANGLMNGKLSFASFFEWLAKELIKIQLQKAMAGVVDGITGAIGGMSWGAGPAETNMGKSVTGTSPNASFADGGIMSSLGSMSLKKYAKGGIARSPQVSLFGEGDTPEAYVPLPDGRSIPVTLSGGLKGLSQQAAPIVKINVINQTSQEADAEQDGDAKFDGEGFIVGVILKNIAKPGPLRNSIKGVK